MHICSLHGHYLGLMLSLGCQEESWGMGMILAVPAVPSEVGWRVQASHLRWEAETSVGIPIPLFLDLSGIITRKPTNLGSAEGGGDIVTCHLNAPEWRACHLSDCEGCELTTELAVMLRATADTGAKVMPFLGGHIPGPICVLVIRLSKLSSCLST